MALNYLKIDSIRHLTDQMQSRIDGENATAFLARQLESIEATIYKILMPELQHRYLIPVSNRDHPGANTITYRMLTLLGMAKVISNYAQDIPRVNVKMEEFTQAIKSVAAMWGISRQEIRNAQMGNMPLETIEAEALRVSIRLAEANVAYFGDTKTGLKGFFTNPNIPILAAITGVGGFTWAEKTADEIVKDFMLMTSKIRIQSKGIHGRAKASLTVLLPIEQYDIAAGIPRSIHSDTTVLEFVTKPGNSYNIKEVISMPYELDNRFVNGTKDGAVVYEKLPRNIEQRIPMELIMYPMQAKNLEFESIGETRLGGVVIRYPLAFCFYTGI